MPLDSKPTPWRFKDDGEPSYLDGLQSQFAAQAGNRNVAFFFDENECRRAVLAVNAHDALVEALRQANDDATWLMVMLGDMSKAAPDNVDRWHRIAARLEAAARAALDAAKGAKRT